MHCLSLSLPFLCDFACGLAQMNYSLEWRYCVSSFKWDCHKERLVCQSKGLEHSLLFTPLLWDQILLSDESDTVGTAAPQQDGQETSADTSVKHIFVPTVGCFSPMGKPENSWPTCNASAPVLHGNQPAAQLRLHRSFQDVTVFLVIAVSFGAKPAPDQDDLWCPSAFELS